MSTVKLIFKLWYCVVIIFCFGVQGLFSQTTVTFNYTGNQQSWIVPSGVFSITVECWGAQGQNALTGAIGGKGAYVKGILSVTPGETLNFFVGGQSGYNGGGNGGINGNTDYGGPPPGTYGGNGGGASDIRQGGIAHSNRVAVAGGGGGAGHNGTWPGCQVAGPAGNGGDAGISFGASGGNGIGFPCNCAGGGGAGGNGGTQTMGGASVGYAGNTACLRGNYQPGGAGSLALGGHGSLVYYNGTGGAGGGGGGYYGGSSGGNGSDTTPGGGGGGGSSYTGSMSNTSATAGLREGDGLIKISYVSNCAPLIWGASPFQDSLWSVDTSTWTIVHRIAPSLQGFTITGINGLAWDHCSHETYCILKLSAVSGRVLGKINLETGVCTWVGNLGDNFATIGFREDGQLFGVTGDGATVKETLYFIDKTNGAKTLATPLGNGLDGEVISYNFNDDLFYHWSGNGTVVYEKFLSYAPFTTTNISTGPPAAEIFGALYLGNNLFIVSTISSDFRYATATGGFGSALVNLPDDFRGMVMPPQFAISDNSVECGETVSWEYCGLTFDTLIYAWGDGLADTLYTPGPGAHQYATGGNFDAFVILKSNCNPADTFRHEVVNVVNCCTISMTCPPDVNYITAPGNCGPVPKASIPLGNPTVNHTCALQSLVNNSPASYPLGVTQVSWTATDVGGNSATCIQKVTVQAGTCGQPVQVYHKDTTENSAKIKWNAGNPCVTGYQLRIRYEISPGVWSSWSAWTNKSGPGNEHSFTGLTSNTYYHYQIRSKCGSATNSSVVNGWFHTLNGGTLKKADDDILYGSHKLENYQSLPTGNGELTNVSIKTIPNPAKDFVNIVLDGFDKANKTLSMMDLLGKQVLKIQVPANENELEMDLIRLNLANGTYIIHVDDGVHRKTIQLVVQR